MNKIDFVKTLLSNSPKIGAFAIGMCSAIAMAFVDKADVNVDPFGACTFMLLAGFMTLWSLTSWSVVYREEE